MMWEVDPETKSKVYMCSSNRVNTSPTMYTKPLSTARTPPEEPWKCDLRRLLCPFPAMGLPQIWHLHLPHMRRPTPRARRPYFVRPLNSDG